MKRTHIPEKLKEKVRPRRTTSLRFLFVFAKVSAECFAD